MASDGSESWLAPPLARLTRIVLWRPRTTIAICAIAAFCAILISVVRLEFKGSRLDLLNPASEYNQRWLTYLEEFGAKDDAVVVVRGGDSASVRDTLDAIVDDLSDHPDQFLDPICRVPREVLEAKGLYFLTAEELEQTDRFATVMEPVLYGRWEAVSLLSQFRQFNAALRRPIRLPTANRDDAATLIAAGDRLTECLDQALAPEPRYRSPWPPLDSTENEADYFQANEGRIGFVLVRPAVKPGSNAGPSVRLLRERLKILADKHPDVQLGLTGLPILEHDEMQASQRDTTLASILSFLGVFLLFAAGFGGTRLPLFALCALVAALAWSLAFVTMTVGHLNLLSVAFGAILIGLGIDFGIHYVARYLQARATMRSRRGAVLATVRSVGPGIFTGGVTTALAFFMASMSEFTGVAELGWIAGGGVLLCVLATLTVLPSCLRIWDPPEMGARADTTPPLPFSLWIRSATSHPKRLMLVSGCVLALLLAGGPRLFYDHNLLHLQPRGLPAVQWEHVLLEQTDRSVWFALSVCDTPEKLAERKQAFEALHSVDRTEEIASLVPRVTPRQRELVERLHQRVRDLPAATPAIPLPTEFQTAIDEEIGDILSRLPPGSQSLAQSLRNVRRQVRATAPEEFANRMERTQQEIADDALHRLRMLRDHSNPAPPSLEDLGEPLVQRFVGRTGKHLLKVYASGDVWDINALRRFVHDLEQVDPQITGHPVQTFYASRQMQHSYIEAAAYALLAIVVVLFLDFRSIPLVVLAMTPMALGLVGLFGALGWLGIPLNAANMIVLPLILGIGIDDGVHVVHDFASNRARRYELGNATATAILITSATTMIGFGSLMLSRHRGLQSLGQVLTLGVFFCMLASLLVLPAILGLIRLPHRRQYASLDRGGGSEPATQT